MAQPDPPLGQSQLLTSVLRDVWCYTRLRDEEQKAWPEEVLGHGSWVRVLSVMVFKVIALSIMVFRVIALRVMVLGLMALGVMSLSLMVLSVMVL